MKRFRFKADLVFDAEDISDALFKLGTHFVNDSKGGLEDQMDFIGELEIKPESDFDAN